MKRFYFLLLAATLLFSCDGGEEPSGLPTGQPNYEPILTDDIVAGFLRVKLSDEVPPLEALHDFSSQFDIKSITRTFPECGPFEERTRAEGLHLWYNVVFDPHAPLTRASGNLLDNKHVAHVEFVRKVVSCTAFNDPFLANQWNFNNPGTKYQYAQGCDINLFPAWEITTGSPEVIVAVADEGVDYRHEDLKDNMWVNQAELNGTTGVDDDGNGYIDDTYGFNFNKNSEGVMVGTVTPDEHGCNVAGIIAAVNNNGVGYCGIAGGDGSGNGVRIMSCQMLDKSQPSGPEEAIKYAADNGAVIINNSWGYTAGITSVSQSLIDAVNYFVKYAGIDASGKQVGPMAGGLVVFAAGNENATVSYPAKELENIIAVAAVGANYKKASYSNYGTWVHIAAPGGDHSNPKAMIQSVGVAGTGNGYTEMVGTSQAAPHVSGVAALVVSKYGGEGFTREMLTNILLKSARPLDAYDPTYAPYMGVGLVDAYAALTMGGSEAPKMPEDITTSVLSNTVTLSFTVPAQEHTEAFGFDVYYSTSSLSDLDPTGPLPQGVYKTRFYREGSGQAASCSLPQLEFNRTYYFRIAAFDAYNRYSELSQEVAQQTGTNTPPVITPLDGTSIELKRSEQKQLRFLIADQDLHPLTFTFTPGSNAAVAKRESGDIVVVTFTGADAREGHYTAYLKASDPYTTSDSLAIRYTILDNYAPEAIKQIDNVVFSAKNERLDIDLTEYFMDKDGEALTYTVLSSSATKVLDATISGSTLSLTAVAFGTTNIAVSAKDLIGARATLSFDVLVRDGSKEIDIYPNPVTDVLYLRASAPQSAKVTIYTQNGGEKTQQEVTMAPFSPGKIDVTSFAPGSYSIEVEMAGNLIKGNFVKL